VVYVHLNSGEVVTVTPATSVAVQPSSVVIYDGSVPVASYPRSQVFSCTRSKDCPALT
jgi:hypothetical protein